MRALMCVRRVSPLSLSEATLVLLLSAKELRWSTLEREGVLCIWFGGLCNGESVLWWM